MCCCPFKDKIQTQQSFLQSKCKAEGWSMAHCSQAPEKNVHNHVVDTVHAACVFYSFPLACLSCLFRWSTLQGKDNLRLSVCTASSTIGPHSWFLSITIVHLFNNSVFLSIPSLFLKNLSLLSSSPQSYPAPCLLQWDGGLNSQQAVLQILAFRTIRCAASSSQRHG